MIDQLDLFTRIAERFEDLPRPTLSYAECTLNFSSHKEPCRHGLGIWEDSDEPTYHTVTHCISPVTGEDMYGREGHKSAGELVNWWLKQPNFKLNVLNSETPTGKWILQNAASLNSARRYWDAYRKDYAARETEREIAELQERLRIQRLDLNVLVRCAAEDRNIDGTERKILLKEFGATDEDLARF